MNYTGNNENQNKSLIVVAVALGVAVVAVFALIIFVAAQRNSSNEPAKTATQPATVQKAATTTKKATTTQRTTKKTTTAKPKKRTLNGITDSDLEQYNVAEPEGGGFMGILIHFTCKDDCDGYELRATYGYGEEWETTQTVYLDRRNRFIYFGTQEEVPMIEIRSYRGTPKNGNAAYSDWREVCNWKIANWSDQGRIYTEDWDVLTKNGYCIDGQI